jgi:PTH1 family peptidyl-tRNA hydrolase
LLAYAQVGFALLDELAASEGISINETKSKALIGKGRIAGTPVVLAKPQTYMNLSGESVGPLARFFKIPVERVLVVRHPVSFCLFFMLRVG